MVNTDSFFKKRAGRLTELLHALDKAAAVKGYYWLVLGIIAFELINLANGNLGKDLWEHRAVVSELVENPFKPDQPIVPMNIPHAFFSPYAVLLGFIGYFTGLTSFKLLFIAGVINLAGLIIALRFFVFQLFDVNRHKIAFYLLLFQFIAWGPAVWRFSSFYHITTLHYVLPYPSTFAFIITLFALGIFVRTEKQKNIKVRILTLPLLWLMYTTVVLTHPTTAIFLIGFTLSFCLSSLIREFNLQSLLYVIAVISIPLVLVGQWPYYPFWDLILVQSQGSQFHAASETLYAKLFIRLLPVWVLLPLLWYRFRKNHFDFYVTTFIGLFILYLYGYFTGQYGYGRVIFFIVFILHIMASEWISGLDTKIVRNVWFASGFLVLILPFLLFHTPRIIRDLIPGYFHKPYKNLSHLNNTISDDDIVLTDITSMLYVPAINGKVIASRYPPYWIPDNEQRLQEVSDFFNSHTTNKIRVDIILKRDIDFILLSNDAEMVPEDVRSFSYAISNIIFSNADYVLLKVNGDKIKKQ